MTLKERVRRYLRHNKAVLFIRLLHEAICETYSLTRHLGVSQMFSNEVKFAADLQIRVHAIEKGLSIGSCRAGFGQPKVQSLINDLSRYISSFPQANIDEAIGVIDRYIDYNRQQGIDMSIIEAQYEKLCRIYEIKNSYEVGIAEKQRSDILEATKADFATFSTSRFSIRDFAPEGKVDINSIVAAIEIARKAPSACNRQSAKAHIFNGKKAQELFDFQGGCKGFSQDIPYAILVTADMRRYFFNERHQMYVDGSLFAMQLLLSLHYKGLATIPLTTAFKGGVTRRILKKFDVPQNEVPIMIIGVGEYKERYKVAISHRQPTQEYYQIHQ